MSHNNAVHKVHTTIYMYMNELLHMAILRANDNVLHLHIFRRTQHKQDRPDDVMNLQMGMCREEFFLGLRASHAHTHFRVDKAWADLASANVRFVIGQFHSQTLGQGIECELAGRIQAAPRHHCVP